MRDYKNPKKSGKKGNRLLREKAPRNWKKIFHCSLRIAVFTFSGVLLIGGAGLGAQVLLDSGYFRIDTIGVENNDRIAEREIIALSDIGPDMSIFSLDLPMIGAKIESDPWIASARIERIFPREVVIKVVERKPWAIINLGYLYYVDGQGEVFKSLDMEDKLDFPVITGIGRDEMITDPEGVKKRLTMAIDLLRELKKRRQFNVEDVSELHCDRLEGLVLYTYRGAVAVHMGQDRFGSKLDRLERIYKEIEPSLSALKYIDLNVAERVIVKVDTRRTVGRG